MFGLGDRRAGEEDLEGAAARQIGSQAELVEPFGEEFRRAVEPLGPDSAALHRIGGETLDVGGDSRRCLVDRFCCILLDPFDGHAADRQLGSAATEPEISAVGAAGESGVGQVEGCLLPVVLAADFLHPRMAEPLGDAFGRRVGGVVLEGEPVRSGVEILHGHADRLKAVFEEGIVGVEIEIAAVGVPVRLRPPAFLPGQVDHLRQPVAIGRDVRAEPLRLFGRGRHRIDLGDAVGRIELAARVKHVGKAARQVDVLAAVLFRFADFRAFVQLVPCLDVDEPGSLVGGAVQHLLPTETVEASLVAAADQRRAAGHGRVIVSRSHARRGEQLRIVRGPPLVLALRLTRPSVHLDKKQIAAEILAEHGPHGGKKPLVDRLGKRAGVEKDEWPAVDRRPMLGRDQREEIADRPVKPRLTLRRCQIDVSLPRVVAEGARVVKHADRRRPLALLEESLSGGDQRRQPLVAPLGNLRRLAPVDRQRRVDPRGDHVLQLARVPVDVLVAESVERLRVVGQRVGAVVVDHVGLGRVVVPVEVGRGDERLALAKRRCRWRGGNKRAGRIGELEIGRELGRPQGRRQQEEEKDKSARHGRRTSLKGERRGATSGQ